MADDVSRNNLYIDETLEDDIEIVEDYADDDEYLLLEKTKGPVWKHFGFKAKDGQFVEKDKWKRTTVYCTICKNPLPYKGNMTNLMVHLQYHHRAEFEEVRSAGERNCNFKFWCAGSATTTRSAYYRTFF